MILTKKSVLNIEQYHSCQTCLSAYATLIPPVTHRLFIAKMMIKII